MNTKTLTFASRLYFTSHGISLDELQVLDDELDEVMNTVTRTPVFPMPLLHDYNEWSNLNLFYKILKKKKKTGYSGFRITCCHESETGLSTLVHSLIQSLS